MAAVQETVDRVRRIDVDQYRYGFETVIESDKAPKGLSEDTIRFISAKKNEPAWMLEWRLEAYRRWLTMTEPKWAKVNYGPIDYQNIYFERLEVELRQGDSVLGRAVLAHTTGARRALAWFRLELDAGPRALSLHFDRWRPPDAAEARPLALMLCALELVRL